MALHRCNTQNLVLMSNQFCCLTGWAKVITVKKVLYEQLSWFQRLTFRLPALFPPPHQRDSSRSCMPALVPTRLSCELTLIQQLNTMTVNSTFLAKPPYSLRILSSQMKIFVSFIPSISKKTLRVVLAKFG